MIPRSLGTLPRLLPAALAIIFVSADRPATGETFTTYTDRSAFTTALTAYWSNGFSGITVSGPLANPASFSGSTSGTFGYSATATGGLYGWSAGTPGPALTTLVSSSSLTFSNFSPSVSAFGGRFWVADFFDGRLITSGTITLALTLSNSTIVTGSMTVSSTSAFLGMTIDPSLSIESATLSMPFDNRYTNNAGEVVVGKSVPEPATFALAVIAAGGVCVGWKRRSRRTAANDAG